MADKVLLVVHQEHSDPGRVGSMLQDLGFELDIRRGCLGHCLPETMDDHAGAVVFGGPMSANDDHIPFIKAELDWIPKVVESGKPYLGICLGAQMLARAGGAKVAPHPDGWHEIGYFPVEPTLHGRDLFEPGMKAFQWHGEGFEVPSVGVHLAAGDKFPNQAFRMGANAYGIQFHPEVTQAMMQRWSEKAAHRLVLPGAQARDAMRRGWHEHDAKLARWLENFLHRWLKLNPAAALAAAAE
jgi:GMP synthase (glutamine-hydrolysing)